MVHRIVRKGIGWVSGLLATPRPAPKEESGLETIKAFARLALAGIDREFPNKPNHVLAGPEDVKSPRELHPVFYGHFDWHSSVHGHWTLVRLLRLFPEAPFSAEIRETLDARLTRDGLEAEAAYFRIPANSGFERMYGWAWALRLADELSRFDDPDAGKWAEHFAPLKEEIVRLAKEYLPKLDWPVRCGFHPETSFPLASMLDHARLAGDTALEALLVEKAVRFHGNDRNYPVAYEPSGNDFFSPGWNTTDLMRRVLPPDEFGTWLDAYLPGLADGEAGNLMQPVTVSDPADGQLIHLAGLNLSRAWAMRGIASALNEEDPRKAVLVSAAKLHFDAGIAHVGTGHYEGDHWLASFALLAMTGQ